MNRAQRFVILIILGLMIVALVALYRSQPVRESKQGKLTVVASFFPLYDFVRVIGGEDVVPVLLFTQTPEVSAMTAENIQTLRSARVVVKLSAGFEPALTDILTALDTKPIVVDATKDLGRVDDPHVWLNPHKALTIVQTIRDALIDADSAHAGRYRDRAAGYTLQLQKLDKEMEAALKGLASKQFIAFHNAFGDFARQYGLEQVAVVEEHTGDEPTPNEVVELIKIVKSKNVRVLFSEPQFNSRVLATIAGETGATILTLDPIETGDPFTNSYLSLSRNNLRVLQEALR